MARDRKKMREALLKRTKASYDSRDDSGRFKSFFKDNLDVKFWKCGKGDHEIDILPYQVGPNDPGVVKGKCKEGDDEYILDVWVHYGVGVNENQYICLARTYDKPCPICEHQAQLLREDDYDEDTVKSLNPSRRGVYNIISYIPDKDEDEGVQVWEVAQYYIESQFTELARDPKTGQPHPFADPDIGKSLAFRRKGEWRQTEYVALKFLDRDYVIDDKTLDEVHCLDETIHVPTYEEVYKAYWGEDPPGGGKVEAEETPASTGRGGRRGSRASAEKSEPESGTVNECPHGLRFGVDLLADPTPSACDECEVWDDCHARSDELAEQDKKEKKEEPISSARRRRRR